MSINILDLEENLKNKIMPLYIITGNDFYFRKRAIDSFLAMFDSTLSLFNITYFNFDEPISNMEIAVNTPPMMCDYRLVVIRGDIKKANKEFENRYDKFISNYLESKTNTILVLLDEDSFFKNVYKKGELIDCNCLEASLLLPFVKKLINAKGYNIDDITLKDFVVRCNSSMTTITNELEKLYAIAENKSISQSDIEEVVTSNIEEGIFKLTDAISNRDIDKAYTLVDTFLEKGEQPTMILGLITAQFKRVFLSKISKDSDNDLAVKLGVKPFAIKLSRSLAKNYKPMQLKKIVDMLQNIEYKIKSGELGTLEGLQLALSNVLYRR